MLKIEIPFKTPSINHLYGQHGVIKFLKPEAKKLREEIEEIIFNSSDLTNKSELREKRLKVLVEIHEDWLTKKGEIKRKDVSNREKFLVDSIFESLGLDDKFIFEHSMRKVQSHEEKAVITIEVLK
jgi:Holliday junction resolvase RusA-like endonuclease